MTKRINEESWLVEFDIPPMAAQPDVGAGQAPGTQPGFPGSPMGGEMPIPQQGANPPEQKDDLAQDPSAPDVPDDFGDKNEDEGKDFEVWRDNYYKESIKGDTNELLRLLKKVRDRKLEPPQKKFVEDNIQVQLLRQHANILQVSKDMRSMIKKELDRNNPATSLVEHMSAALEKVPYVNDCYIKLFGMGGQKGTYHRYLITSMLGGVQVGSGGNKEDIIFNETEYSIAISTRFNSEFGNVTLGNWSLKEDDPERYLKSPELERLESGSPEEKDVLRRRVVLYSIAEMYKTRAFLIDVVNDDGTIYHLGCDLATCLKTAYTDGKLVVRVRHSDESEAIITDEGQIVPSIDLNIYYVQETGKMDADERPETEELLFIEQRDGQLLLSANLNVIKNASSAITGLNLKEIPYTGNPSDIPKISRNIPSATEVLMRQEG